MILRALRISLGFAVPCALIALIAVNASAIRPGRWEFVERSDFAQGRMKGLEITQGGRIRLGLSASPASVPVDYIWSLAEFSDEIYLGTGDGAKIFRSAKDGRDTVSLVWDGDGLEVYTLAKTAEGNLVAGISPVGEIRVFGRENGRLRELYSFRVPDSYVWRILPVGEDFWIAAGSGKVEQGGAIYRYRNGRVELVHRVEDHHVLSLARLGDRIYAGTQGAVGLILEFNDIYSDQPRVGVVLDPPQNEIVELVVGDDGAVYAAALSQGGRPAPREAVADSDDNEEEGPPSPPTVAAKDGNAVYRIEASGKSEVWLPAKNMIRPMINGPHGLLVATSDQGTVFRIDGVGRTALVLRFDEKVILALSENFAATAKPAVLYRLHKDPAQAYLRSQVLDAEARAAWGAVTFDAVGQWEIKTRSGNSLAPDATWSDWSAPIKASGERIVSPMGRYLQYEITTRGDNPDDYFRELSIAFQVWNRAPRISNLSVKKVSFEQGATPKLGQAGPMGQVVNALLQAARNVVKQSDEKFGNYTLDEFVGPFSGLMHVTWTKEDPDEDELLVNIELIDEISGSAFKVAENFSGDAFLLNAANFPDGRYHVRVTVTDKSANNVGSELAHAAVSEIFAIDNTAPEITVTGGSSWNGTVEYSGSVRDRSGAVADIFYLDENGAWKMILPDDGIADQPSETFRFIRPNKEGAPPVVVKAVDQNGNVGYSRP